MLKGMLLYAECNSNFVISMNVFYAIMYTFVYCERIYCDIPETSGNVYFPENFITYISTLNYYQWIQCYG